MDLIGGLGLDGLVEGAEYSPFATAAQLLKMFRYSFFGTIPHFLNRLLDSLLLVKST